jgi:peptidoglycan/LPS O-acetylase OafA/YrhL
LHFRADINGLRAIAVIAVMLFHFTPSWMPGGFAGVDVFFVISGFLMTGIIYKGLEQKNFILFKFYVARANRIIPALAVLCLVLLVIGFILLTPWEYRTLGKHAGSSIGFVSNVIYWMESGYFAAASKQKWLIHTWSLSVEWQFYILYPLLLLAVAKVLSLRLIKPTILLATFAGLLFSVIATELWPKASYFMLSTRAWEMMFGGIAYLYPWQVKSRYKLPLEWLGIGLILLAYFSFSEQNPWPGYLALVPVVGTFLVLQAQRATSAITNNYVFQQIGASSYSIYLWHWPVVVLGYYYTIPNWVFVGIPISLLLGGLSYRYIETLRFKKITQPKHLYKVVPLYLCCATGLIASMVFINNGANLWLDRQAPLARQTYSAISQHFAGKTNWGMNENGVQDLSPCRFNTDQLTTANIAQLSQCAADYGPGILILGDSHAIDLFGVVASRFDDPFIVGITSVGCRPHHADPNCQYQAVKALLAKNSLFKHIIYEQGGFYLLRDPSGNNGSRSMFTNLGLTEEVSGISINTENIAKVIAYLRGLSNSAPVTWFGSRIEPHISDRQILRKGCDFSFSLRPKQRQPFNELDQYISAALAPKRTLNYVSQNKLFHFDFSRDLMTCELKFWDDGDHFSSTGEQRFGTRLPADFLQFSSKQYTDNNSAKSVLLNAAKLPHHSGDTSPRK